MDYSKATLIVISGPNGAGKSTHIQKMLPTQFRGIWAFDRDKTRTEFENRLRQEGLVLSEIPVKATRLTFEAIELYDGMKGPVLLARVENNKVVNASGYALKKAWIKNGLPSIFNDIKSFIQSP